MTDDDIKCIRRIGRGNTGSTTIAQVELDALCDEALKRGIAYESVRNERDLAIDECRSLRAQIAELKEDLGAAKDLITALKDGGGW